MIVDLQKAFIFHFNKLKKQNDEYNKTHAMIIEMRMLTWYVHVDLVKATYRCKSCEGASKYHVGPFKRLLNINFSVCLSLINANSSRAKVTRSSSYSVRRKV